MKKATIGILFCLFVTSLFLFTACNTDKIGTPKGIVFDEDNNMTWTEVADTKNYVVEVTDYVTKEVVLSANLRKPLCSLADLSEGDYDIRIKAIPSSRMKEESDWSETIFFHKIYETGCVYTLINNEREYQISRVGRAQGEFTIEDVYRGKPVTAIADSAFYRSKTITSVTVGKNVTSIGESAFANCVNLEKVVLSDNITFLGNACFMSCNSLKVVNIPAGITELNEYIFAYCPSLESITIPDNVNTIYESAFINCTALTEVVIPDSVTAIYQKAFYYCSALESVTIGSGVKTIYDQAFASCSLSKGITFSPNSSLTELDTRVFAYSKNLTGVVLPEGLQYIGTNCFASCPKFETVDLPDSLTNLGASVFYKTKICPEEEVNYGEKLFYADNWLVGVSQPLKITVESIGDGSVPPKEDGTPAKRIDIAEGTVGLCQYIFAKAELLQSVILPRTVKYVCGAAFSQCPKLYKFDAYDDDELLVVGNSTFYECTNLTNVRMGQKVKEIGAYCFYMCSGLDVPSEENYHLLVPDSIRKIGGQAFLRTKLWNTASVNKEVYAGKWVVGIKVLEDLFQTSLNITLKDDTIGIADYAFSNVSMGASILSVNNTNSVKYIGAGAFYGCEDLTTFVITDNIIEVPDFMFYGCKNLKDIGTPLNLERIGRSAFYGCSSLKNIDLSSLYRLESIGQSAFAYCQHLSEVILPEYGVLENISDYAFYYCNMLEKVTIPDTITSIGQEAFASCFALETLTFEQNETGSDKLTEIGDSAFYQCYTLKEVVIPDTVQTIGKAAFYGCVSVENLQLSSALTYIGENAFCGLNQITDVEFGDNLKYIGNYAFSGCESLRSINLSKNVEWIGSWAFFQCNLATIYTDADAFMPNWSGRINPSYRPIVWSATLSEDNNYVVSVTKKADSIYYGNEYNIISAPSRRGYIFKGYTLTEGGVTPEYSASELSNLSDGTVLYAVWEAEPEPVPDENPPADQVA